VLNITIALTEFKSISLGKAIMCDTTKYFRTINCQEIISFYTNVNQSQLCRVIGIKITKVHVTICRRLFPRIVNYDGKIWLHKFSNNIILLFLMYS